MPAHSAPHVLLYPYLSSGHVIPLLDLAHRLLTRGLTVTVLITPNNLPLLQQLLSLHGPSIQPLILPSPKIDSSKNFLTSSLQSMKQEYYPHLLQWFQSHPSPPVAIISDIFLGWTHHLASQVGIRRVVFSPSAAFDLSVCYSTWRDLPKVDDPNDVNSVVSFPTLPNSPIYPWWQMPHHYRDGMEGDSDWEFLRESWLENLASWGVVFNSFTELERVYFDHLKKELGHDRVWAVGPLLPQTDVDVAGRGGSSTVPHHEMMRWLDRHPDLSVVYISFGSRTVLTRKQLDVLVKALEQSGVRFVLCVLAPDERHVELGNDIGVIPDWFEDRVAGRGFVIKGWAPQVAILRHRAVGSFLTHGGWNSVLEGLSAGVVMLTWPMGADQFTNAKLLVDQLGIGIRAGEGTVNIPEPNELTQVLINSLDQNRPERARAKELSHAAQNATVKGGSSDGDLDRLVKQLTELQQGK